MEQLMECIAINPPQAISVEQMNIPMGITGDDLCSNDWQIQKHSLSE
jgi:hypothetical protein